jgi:hypothetical protein
MKRAEILTALVLLLVAGAALGQAVRLGAGWGEDGPHAGFFPFWLGVILAAASLGILGRALWTRDAGLARPFFPPGGLRLVLTVFLPMVGAFALFEVVGFYAAAFVYLLVYVRLTGRQPWALTLAFGVLFPLVAFVLFERWFLIPLPKGRFGEFLLPF